jgi:Kef-type K+ transport system membrane component KefB
MRMYLAGPIQAQPEFFFLVVIASVIVGPILAERLRLPGMLGLLVLGLVIGPNGLNLLSRPESLKELGTIGLLYLMFMAGLELDLGVFARFRRAAITFGLLTFACPFVLGLISALAFGFTGEAAVLIGSFWASHTLIAYPIVRRLGLTANRAVAATVGATVMTDTLALSVLAVVAGLETGAGTPTVVVLKLVAGFVVLLLFCFVVLPRVGRWFFAGVGQERALRFLYLLAGFLAAAVVADVGGIEGIVGAFFAGLGMNRLVPNNTPLMERTEFVGSAVFVPIFLVSVGLIVQPSVLLEPRTLLLAAVFTVAVLGGKLIAAWIAGRMFRFGAAEIGVMFGLSSAQAAATLAATVIGFDIHLYGQDVVNAVVLVIVISLVVTSVTVSRSGIRIASSEGDEPARSIGRTVMVPLAQREGSEAALALAGRLAEADGGVVVPLHVSAGGEAGNGSRAAGRELTSETERIARSLGLVTTEPVLRVDRSVAAGIRGAVAEHDASFVLLTWRGRRRTAEVVLGGHLDELVAHMPVLMGVAALTGTRWHRVLVAVDRADLQPARRQVLRDTLAVAALLAKTGPQLQVAASDADAVRGLLASSVEVTTLAGRGRGDWLRAEATEGDLVVLLSRLGPHVFAGEAAELAERRGVSVLVVAEPYGSGALQSGAEVNTRVTAPA